MTKVCVTGTTSQAVISLRHSEWYPAGKKRDNIISLIIGYLTERIPLFLLFTPY